MRGTLSGAVTLLAVGVSWSLLQSQASTVRADASEQKAEQALTKVSELDGKVSANGKALNEANSRLIALGKAPVPVPSPPPAQASPEGLTASQLEAVRAVVVDVLDSHNAKVSQATINQITQASASLATQNVTAGLQAVVKATVIAYCVDDKCRGPVGPTGPAGRVGGDGKPAPAVTDEQLLQAATQALAAYCGQDSKPCLGPQGPAGVAGKDAPPAYSVVDQDCVGDGDQSFWRIYLSNGTDQHTVEAAGPCRIGPAPN